MKKPFLVMYDYGQGAVWAFVLARGEREIQERFPELKVMHWRPDWMDAQQADKIRRKLTVDIDEPKAGFLPAILNQRKGQRPTG